MTPRTVMVIGATGFVGSVLCTRLRRAGFTVVGVSRGTRGLEQVERMIRLDLRAAAAADIWLPHLDGVDAVVNCAGVLQDSPRDSTEAVHVKAPAALYAACQQAGVMRVIHFSAMGAEGSGLTAFSSSKGRIEAMLRSTLLNWVILRPSVVVGRAAYGGSALFRGLASLPLLPDMRSAGRISVVQLDDVVETVLRLLDQAAPSRVAICLAGPQALSFEQIIGRYRRWLGWRPAKRIEIPSWMLGLVYLLGDLAGALGWRPPIRTTARIEMARGAAADAREWTALTGIAPQSLDAALSNEPASVQERWFSRLYLLRPLALLVFAAFWILTGAISLTSGWAIGVALMQEGGAGELSSSAVVAGALADLAIGAAILWRPVSKWGLLAALAITFFYVIAGTTILPRLWNDPLGPLMKVWPILAFNLLLLAILDER